MSSHEVFAILVESPSPTGTDSDVLPFSPIALRIAHRLCVAIWNGPWQSDAELAIIPCMTNHKMDKVVVLARGLGTRMRRNDAAAQVDGRQAAVAEAGIKALIPIDRPFLDYVLSAAADAGYRHVCLVIGPEQEAIREYYGGKVAAEKLDFTFACQPEPKGTADAVAAAEAFAGDDPFVGDQFRQLLSGRGACRPCASSRARPWRCSSATPCLTRQRARGSDQELLRWARSTSRAI